MPTILPKELYTLYFIQYHWRISPPGSRGKKYLRTISIDYLQNIKEKYIEVFGEIVVKQLVKYYERDRIVSSEPFDYKKVEREGVVQNLKYLQDMMEKSRRSDMQRHNVRWEKFVDYLIELYNARSFDDLLKYLDKMTNAVHNTRTKILGKLPNGRELLDAMNEIASSNNPREYSRKMNQDIRRDFELLSERKKIKGFSEFLEEMLQL